MNHSGTENSDSTQLSCVFCGIVKRTVGSYIIYEDAEYIAFLDKYPISVGHTLVLPKKHFGRVNDLSQKEFCALYARVHALNRHITTKLGAAASHISINDGAAANQLIPHVHVHIIPRNPNDSAGFTARKVLRRDEMEAIRKNLEIEELGLTS
jgi:histidine triad (HIT) family protein